MTRLVAAPIGPEITRDVNDARRMADKYSFQVESVHCDIVSYPYDSAGNFSRLTFFNCMGGFGPTVPTFCFIDAYYFKYTLFMYLEANIQIPGNI